MKAISSMATRHLLADLTAAAASAGLPSVAVESVGGVNAGERVSAGETFDLVFLASDALTRLAEEGRVDAATVTPLVVSQVAVAVTSGIDEPAAWRVGAGAAFADAAGLRSALLAATRIGYSSGPSGTALVKMIESWGLAPMLGDRLVQARPGVPVARSVAAGEVALGFQQLSELVGQRFVQILGVMPADCAIDTVFSGAVCAGSTDPVGAAELLAFLASDEVAHIKARHAFSMI